MVVALVRNYYHNKPFAVVTPYDAQRAAIEKALKGENLPWEGHVFNVDSFQGTVNRSFRIRYSNLTGEIGNEQSYIIISVVRTKSPGFLVSKQRMNVMLSRCKNGMIIVSNTSFLLDGRRGGNTLVGKLANHWQDSGNPLQSQEWVTRQQVFSKTAALPGFPASTSAVPSSTGALRYIPKPTLIRSEHRTIPMTKVNIVLREKEFPRFVWSERTDASPSTLIGENGAAYRLGHDFSTASSSLQANNTKTWSQVAAAPAPLPIRKLPVWSDSSTPAPVPIHKLPIWFDNSAPAPASIRKLPVWSDSSATTSPATMSPRRGSQVYDPIWPNPEYAELRNEWPSLSRSPQNELFGHERQRKKKKNSKIVLFSFGVVSGVQRR